MTEQLSAAAIIFATLMGPVFAVQIQKWLERAREEKARQFSVFEALMATRASRMSPRHVEALNAIPIAFYEKGQQLEKIRTEWNDYFAHLCDKTKQEENRDAWIGEQIPKIVGIIYQISTYLGYSFSKKEIEKGIYLPEGFATIEADQHLIRWGFARVFEGKFGFPIYVLWISARSH
jgi:hypothetical protein